MKLSELKVELGRINELRILLPDGKILPEHFHITEVGQITKNFIDCGGTVRSEKVVNFQLWHANDFEHRLSPEKTLNIIDLSEKKLGIEDAEIEVEYQGETISKFGLKMKGNELHLTRKFTDCLASDKCGIPVEKQKIKLSELTTSSSSCCTPGGGCC